MNLISWPLRENKLSFFLPRQLQSCGCADQQSRIIPGTGKKIFKKSTAASLPYVPA
uniref:Uncharacterized protein n=1 Tax=Klebsiella pneumoniae TaxID=573 RepID=A0A8B0SN96_KLEPN|nr:hypothetical protein [Klebsiella pneumoniae]